MPTRKTNAASASKRSAAKRPDATTKPFPKAIAPGDNPGRLWTWMIKHGESDETLAERTGISRAHISRIRRGINGAGKQNALLLESVTRIPWHAFILD